MDNDHLIPYYTRLLSLPDNDMAAFIRTMNRPLPLVLRISKCTQYHTHARALLARMGFARMADNIYTTRADECTEHDRLLISAMTDLNILTVQELVSHIPSSFIITMHARRLIAGPVLDLCAAPGSKTTHMLENGIDVLANDVCARRCSVLQHRTRNMPKTLTCTDGTCYARVRTECVLADVPCSGDGTFRKNRVRVRAKNTRLMARLLDRAVRVSSAYVVYSTCAVDACENEAVVETVLDRCEVVGCDEIGNDIFEFVRHDGCTDRTDQTVQDGQTSRMDRMGLTDQTAQDGQTSRMDRMGRTDQSIQDGQTSKTTKMDIDQDKTMDMNQEDAQNGHTDKDNMNSKRSSHTIVYREGMTEWMSNDKPYTSRHADQLRKCMRFYPHDNDSSAFFVAILRKKDMHGQTIDRSTDNGKQIIDKPADNDKQTSPTDKHDQSIARPTDNDIQSVDRQSINTSNGSITSLIINHASYTPVNPSVMHSILAHYGLSMPGHFIATATYNRIYHLRSTACTTLTRVRSAGLLVFSKVRDGMYRMNNLWYTRQYMTSRTVCIDVSRDVFISVINGHRHDCDEYARYAGTVGVIACDGLMYCAYFGREKMYAYINEKEKVVIRAIIDMLWSNDG